MSVQRADDAGRGAAADLRLFGAALGMWGATLAALRLCTVVAVVAAAIFVAGAGTLGWRGRRGLGRRRVHGARRPAGNAAAGGMGAAGEPHDSRLARAARARSARWSARRWAAIAVLLGAACGGMATAARTAGRDATVLSALANSQATVRAEVSVTDDPRALSSSGTGPLTYLIPATLRQITTADGTITLDVRVIIFASDPAWRSLLPTTQLVTKARLAPARGDDLTAAVLSASGAPQIVAGPSWWQRAAGALRAGLQAACAGLPPEPGGLLPGLVVGDTTRLDPALKADFQRTGLTHLTAVSGANLAIVVGAVLALARWCRAGPWLSAALCVLALVGFVILARPSPSVVRAAAMGGIGLLALATGRRRSAAPALAAAVIVTLVLDPGLAVDVGFALSVCATGALVLLAPHWCAALRARGWPMWLAAALAAPAAAQVACGPIIAAISGGVSVVAVPANLLVAAAVAPATMLGICAAVMSAFWPGAAALLAWLGSWPARWLITVAHAGAEIPAGTLPWPSGAVGGVLLAVVTVALLVAMRWAPVRRYALAAVVAVAIGVVPLRTLVPSWPPADAVLVMCDVGQGDALVLPVAGDAAVVVDTGPDPVLVDGCLRRLGIDSVPLLVLSHFHVDHVGGIAGVFRHRTVGAILVPAFDEPESGRELVRRAAGQLALTEANPGRVYHSGPVQLTVLGPVRIETGTRSDPNNNSLVLRVQHGNITMMLAGDAEVEEQRDLVENSPQLLAAPVLKIAHHGSSYQDSQFLAAVDPAVALVSVGAGNPYGHPNAALLAGLGRHGVTVVRTDQAGDIAVVATGEGTGLGVVTTRDAGLAVRQGAASWPLPGAPRRFVANLADRCR